MSKKELTLGELVENALNQPVPNELMFDEVCPQKGNEKDNIAGGITIVGEVATDDITERMIEMGKIASLFTIFSRQGLNTWSRTTDSLKGY